MPLMPTSFMPSALFLITKPSKPLSETKTLAPPPKITKGILSSIAVFKASFKSSTFLASKKIFAGPPKIFFEAKNVEDLKLALKTAIELKIPFVILGGGANVLVSDSGFDGLVIKNRADGIKLV